MWYFFLHLQHLVKFRREELSSFDCSSLIHQDDTDSTNMSNKFDDIIHPRMRVFFSFLTCIIIMCCQAYSFCKVFSLMMQCNNGAVPCHQVKGCLLLAEYNILCEAFDVVTSCLRYDII